MAAPETLPPRPKLDERSTYVPRARVEKFMVGLLAEAIPRAVAKWADATPAGTARVLDVGCGRQPFRTLLESRGFAYFGLDTQQNEDHSVAFVVPIDGALPEAMLTGGPFQFILCTETLEHVADWHAAWTNLTRLLAPGGRMLISCPHIYPLHEEPYDFWRPTPHALRFFAARHGLRVLEQQQLGDGWDVLATAAMAISPRAAKGTLNPLAYVLGAVIRTKRKFLFLASGQPWIRQWVPAPSKLYLSNLIVLEKPV